MLKTRWETIRDDVAEMLADGVPLEDITGKLEKLKNEYQKPMTNEEWFCQLPTTEKSEFLSAMVKQAIKVYEIHGCTWHETVSWWDGWLKEKHE